MNQARRLKGGDTCRAQYFRGDWGEGRCGKNRKCSNLWEPARREGAVPLYVVKKKKPVK